MANGTDSKYRSRKFLIAGTQLAAVTAMAVWGCRLAGSAQDVALVIGAWGVVAGAIGKLYNDANLAARGGG